MDQISDKSWNVFIWRNEKQLLDFQFMNFSLGSKKKTLNVTIRLGDISLMTSRNQGEGANTLVTLYLKAFSTIEGEVKVRKSLN